jgi:hypothetical protein
MLVQSAEVRGWNGVAMGIGMVSFFLDARGRNAAGRAIISDRARGGNPANPFACFSLENDIFVLLTLAGRRDYAVVE